VGERSCGSQTRPPEREGARCFCTYFLTVSAKLTHLQVCNSWSQSVSSIGRVELKASKRIIHWPVMMYQRLGTAALHIPRVHHAVQYGIAPFNKVERTHIVLHGQLNGKARGNHITPPKYANPYFHLILKTRNTHMDTCQQYLTRPKSSYLSRSVMVDAILVQHR
jgi:hypothetical protein